MPISNSLVRFLLLYVAVSLEMVIVIGSLFHSLFWLRRDRINQMQAFINGLMRLEPWTDSIVEALDFEEILRALPKDVI